MSDLPESRSEMSAGDAFEATESDAAFGAERSDSAASGLSDSGDSMDAGAEDGAVSDGGAPMGTGSASGEGNESLATPATPTPTEPEARDPNILWYAIRVQSNKEETVRRALENKVKLRGLGRKIIQVVVPTEKIAEIKNGRKRTRAVKTYPGYVLIEMLMDDESWSFVRETAGVGDFVGGGGGAHQKPFALLPEEVAKIFGQEVPGDVAPKIQLDFGVGDKVKIREGPFENFDGVVEDVNEQKGLVRVVVTIFGRHTPVELQYWQVESI